MMDTQPSQAAFDAADEIIRELVRHQWMSAFVMKRHWYAERRLIVAIAVQKQLDTLAEQQAPDQAERAEAEYFEGVGV